MTPLPTELRIALPAWLSRRLAGPIPPLAGDEARMGLAVELALENVARGTGGPFGAVVFPVGDGPLVSAAVNVVVESGCSLAHAETLALGLAEGAAAGGEAATGAPLELLTTAQPCIQCLGAIWWSGIRRLVIGASREDVESACGFREGPLPAEWAASLRERRPPVEVVSGVLAEECRAVLRAYRDAGGPAYGPR